MFFLGVIGPDLEVDRSSPSGAEVKNDEDIQPLPCTTSESSVYCLINYALGLFYLFYSLGRSNVSYIT
jgi:hypothetical protein